MMLLMMMMYNKNLLRCVVNHVGSNIGQRVDDGSRDMAKVWLDDGELVTYNGSNDDDGEDTSQQ